MQQERIRQTHTGPVCTSSRYAWELLRAGLWRLLLSTLMQGHTGIPQNVPLSEWRLASLSVSKPIIRAVGR